MTEDAPHPDWDKRPAPETPEAELEALRLLDEAIRLMFREVYGDFDGEDLVTAFNDAEGRTKRDVMAVLIRAGAVAVEAKPSNAGGKPEPDGEAEDNVLPFADLDLGPRDDEFSPYGPDNTREDVHARLSAMAGLDPEGGIAPDTGGGGINREQSPFWKTHAPPAGDAS